MEPHFYGWSKSSKIECARRVKIQYHTAPFLQHRWLECVFFWLHYSFVMIVFYLCLYSEHVHYFYTFYICDYSFFKPVYSVFIKETRGNCTSDDAVISSNSPWRVQVSRWRACYMKKWKWQLNRDMDECVNFEWISFLAIHFHHNVCIFFYAVCYSLYEIMTHVSI